MYDRCIRVFLGELPDTKPKFTGCAHILDADSTSSLDTNQQVEVRIAQPGRNAASVQINPNGALIGKFKTSFLGACAKNAIPANRHTKRTTGIFDVGTVFKQQHRFFRFGRIKPGANPRGVIDRYLHLFCFTGLAGNFVFKLVNLASQRYRRSQIPTIIQ